MDRLLQAAVAVIGVPAATVGYIVLAEKVIGLLPARGAARVRPWFWLAPALALLFVFLVYPSLNTVNLSLLDATSTAWVGLRNYEALFTDAGVVIALRNNVIWVVVFTSATVIIGLVLAVLTDRVPYEGIAKALIFLPLAISFVAAGVIWRFMYDYRAPPLPQTGTLNAFLTAVVPRFEPQAWLVNNLPFNNLALIAAAVWIWTGFCLVILSAALKGIPVELLEAARVDGATELQIFRRILVPLLAPTLAVVATTMIIFALKAFDIVYVMTNGNFDTEVIANRMYKEMFNVRDFGRASAIAVVLLVAIVPVMLFNVRRFRAQEEQR
jgi:alpha-glucoside transport system permease protein